MKSFAEVLKETMKYASENLEDASDNRPCENMCKYMVVKRCNGIRIMQSMMRAQRINHMLVYGDGTKY